MSSESQNQRLPPSIGCSQETAKNAIRRLLSGYRRDEYADPELFVLQLGILLQAYPAEVVNHVTSHPHGLQFNQKFPPALAEVKEACDQRVAHLELVAKVGHLPRITQVEPEGETDPEQRKQIGILLSDLSKTLGGEGLKKPLNGVVDDGKHGVRVAVELAAKRQANQTDCEGSGQ